MSTQKSSEKIKAQIAARRPKISKEEAAKRRQASMRRFKRTDFISVVVLTAVLIGLQFRLFQASLTDAPSTMLFDTFLLYCGAVTLQLAFIILTTFTRFNNDRFMSEDKTDHLLKGIRFTYFVPLISIAVLLPALFSGVFVDQSTNAADAVWLILLSQFFILLSAPLVAAFVLVPLQLVAKGMVAIIRGDKSQYHLGIVGLLIAGLTAFILVGTLAVAPANPFPVGSIEVVLSILGIPGNYEIQSELYLWVVRGIVAFYIAVFAYSSYRGKKDKSS